MNNGEIFGKLFSQYKRFEKCFFRADKSLDKIAYIKLKHQFRTMVTFAVLALVAGIYMQIVHQHFLPMTFLLALVTLLGFRANAYRAMQILFFLGTMTLPTKYASTSFVLATPAAVLFSTVQILIHSQSDSLTMINFALQFIGFYFYGLDRMEATIKRMSPEELAGNIRAVIAYTFFGGFLNLVCMRLFYAQFASLLNKVSTLTESLSKANSQLNNQNLKLQNNLEMKDVFIYTFSHELKNALNGLLGNLGLAFDSVKDPRAAEFLSSAQVCGEVLKNFINNILDSGKLENGNLEVAPERKDVMNFLQNVWAICGRIIQNKRLQGYLEIEKNVPKYLELDEQRVIQIILNMVSNAVKFTEKGHVRIRVRWQTISTSGAQLDSSENKANNQSQENSAVPEEEDEAALFNFTEEFSDTLEDCPSNKENCHLATEHLKKFLTVPQFYQLNLAKWSWTQEESLSSNLSKGSQGILRIQVLDTGCGMTSEDQTMLFQKFSQVSPAQGQRKIGVGLGLWICKELATRLYGDIKTRSSVGVGSVFEFAIRTKVSSIPENSRTYQRPRDQVARNCLQRKVSLGQRAPNTMKTLIVDDDSFNIELMKNYLNKFGISYICAYDGKEAVSLFKTYHREICFVITDNFMPRKTGVEAAMEIANFLEEKRRPKIPILCISGDVKVHVETKGITSVIQKPINFDRLKEELLVIYPQIADEMNI